MKFSCIVGKLAWGHPEIGLTICWESPTMSRFVWISDYCLSHIYLCMHTYTYVYTRSHTYIHIHIYICIHRYIHVSQDISLNTDAFVRKTYVHTLFPDGLAWGRVGRNTITRTVQGNLKGAFCGYVFFGPPRKPLHIYLSVSSPS